MVVLGIDTSASVSTVCLTDCKKPLALFTLFSMTEHSVALLPMIEEALTRSGKKLSELAKCMTVYPQVLVNVKVSEMGKVRYKTDEEIKKAVNEAKAELGNDGRVLVRVSGTEPLIRVMLEGKNEPQITRLANEIAEVVRERLI